MKNIKQLLLILLLSVISLGTSAFPVSAEEESNSDDSYEICSSEYSGLNGNESSLLSEEAQGAGLLSVHGDDERTVVTNPLAAPYKSVVYIT